MTPLRFLIASLVGSAVIAWWTYPLMERLGIFPSPRLPTDHPGPGADADEDLSPFAPPPPSALDP